MQFIRDYKKFPSTAYGSVLLIGNFDGVHLGHVKLIEKARKLAKNNKSKLSLLTFDPHPSQIIHSTQNLNILTLNNKIEKLKDHKIDLLLIQKFTTKFAKLNASDFIRNIVMKHIKPKHIAVGENFHFGANKKGDITSLYSLSKELNFNLKVIPLYKYVKSYVISSSQIRKFLQLGKITEASYALGYKYFISGEVVHGTKKGNKINIPTANIHIKNIFTPKLGVYIAEIYINNIPNKHYGIVNIGPQPTFNAKTVIAEAHLFKFNNNIYGKNLKIIPLEYIRPQKKFDTIQHLKQQIESDIILAKHKLLNHT